MMKLSRLTYVLFFMTGALLVVCILSYYQLLFQGMYTVRKWIWYSTGLSFISTFVSVKEVREVFNKQRKLRFRQLFIYWFALVICMFLFSYIYPRLRLKDVYNIYKNNSAEFHAIAEQRDTLLQDNGSYRCLFEYTGKRYNIICDTPGYRNTEDVVINMKMKDRIDDFMYENDLSIIVMTSDTVKFIFTGYDVPQIVMLQDTMACDLCNMIRVDSDFFIKP